MFLCMHRHTQKKLKAQPLSRLGLKLAEEEHEQKADNLNQLLEAQLQFDCQRKHGNSLVCAGRPANLLKVGFGGYEWPRQIALARILSHLTEVLRSPPGITVRPADNAPSAGRGSQFLKHNVI